MNTPRIVSLLSSATEIVYALGLGEQVLAISHECDWPPEATHKPRATSSVVDSSRPSGEIDQQVKQLYEAGEPLYAIDVELIRSLRPNLIVTQAQCDVCAVRFDDVRALVESQPELTETRLLSLEPNRLDDIFRDIALVGEATGRRQEAKDFVTALRNRVAVVQAAAALQVAKLGRPKRVALIEWTDPIMLAANWNPELVTLAGGDCPLTPVGEASRYHSWDEVRQFDPEIMVIAPCGFALERAIVEAAGLERLPGWSETSAARENRVYAMDGNAYLNRSGPRIVDTLEILAELIWNTTSVVTPARRSAYAVLPIGGRR
jgi:iron complex transport system substrate-binding protein